MEWNEFINKWTTAILDKKVDVIADLMKETVTCNVCNKIVCIAESVKNKKVTHLECPYCGETWFGIF